MPILIRSLLSQSQRSPSFPFTMVLVRNMFPRFWGKKSVVRKRWNLQFKRRSIIFFLMLKWEAFLTEPGKNGKRSKLFFSFPLSMFFLSFVSVFFLCSLIIESSKKLLFVLVILIKLLFVNSSYVNILPTSYGFCVHFYVAIFAAMQQFLQ